MKKATVIGVILCAVMLTGIVLFGIFFTVGTVTVRFENDVIAVKKEEIYSAIPIDSYTNIFSVNEKKVKESVESSIPGNVIEVTSVVRSFPNSVAVVVRERTPVFKIALAQGNGFVVSDKDFRRYSVYDKDATLDFDVVEVEGFSVNDSFAVESCYQLKSVVAYFVSSGFADDAVTSFLKKISFVDDKLVVTLFDDATFTVDKKDRTQLQSDLDSRYKSYLALTYSARAGKNF